MKSLRLVAAMALLLASGLVQAAVAPAKHAKKRILLVTTSVDFRHHAAGLAEKVLREIATASGEFEIVSTSDSPDFPVYAPPQDWETVGRADSGPPMGPALMAGSAGIPAALRGGADTPVVKEKVRRVLAQYLSAKALKQYDAVFFVNTNGELPLPDPQAFLDWIQAGHGYLGTHSAAGTLELLRGYGEMVGGVGDHHGHQETVKLSNDDPANPMTAAFGSTQIADDEWYLFKPSYDRSKVHSLYSMTEHPNDKTAGHYPVAWCKYYGKGRVYFTSQGHRYDIWDSHWIGTDGQRTNTPEAVAAFRAGLLAAMRWTTGLIQANCTP
jgi:type 1 glutamine amidotransferase